MVVSNLFRTFANGNKLITKSMARAKKIAKPKEPVRLRLKELSNGNRSIYLDIYSNGKRSYEFLKMYLVPETTEAAKLQNANTMQAANFVKSQRIIQMTNDGAGVVKKDTLQSKVLLLDYMANYEQRKKETGQSENNALAIHKMIIHLKQYCGEGVALQDVDEEFCRGFIRYLITAKTKYGKKEPYYKQISKNSASRYFVHFASGLNEAVRRKLIPANPTKYLSQDDRRLLKTPQPQRGHLTIEEVRKLIDTDCDCPQVKQAFLFSCFCGLRISDVRSLRWVDIDASGEQWSIAILMQKTRERLYLPLSSEARRWLPDRGSADDEANVFSKLQKSTPGLNAQLKKWVKSAGITKTVCFHTSRHTFATSLLTLGADLYTTSKLLGHKKISTTQIYAEIVNKKKVDAVNLMGAAFSNKVEEEKK